MATKYRNSEPATVNTGDIAVYTKAGQLCIKDDSNIETCFVTTGDIPDPSPRYEAFDSNGTQALNGTYQIITMETEVNPETGYSLSGGGIQVANAGAYKYDFKVSADATDGTRATTRAAIFINGTELERTRAFAYHRTTANGEDTATSSGVLTLAANDVVTVQALIFGDGVLTIANASNLTLEVNS